MPNLVEGILNECNRNRELLKAYEEIGPNGAFGAEMIRRAITEGEAALASGDVVRMVEACDALQKSE